MTDKRTKGGCGTTGPPRTETLAPPVSRGRGRIDRAGERVLRAAQASRHAAHQMNQTAYRMLYRTEPTGLMCAAVGC